MTEEQVKQKSYEEIQEKLRQAYAQVAKTKAGKIIMEDLEKICGANRTSVDFKEWSTNQVFYHEGMRNVWLYIKEKSKGIK